MLIEDSERVLSALLADAGVTPGPVDGAQVGTVVDVVRRFVLLPVEDAAASAEDGDGLLAQYGTSTSWGPRTFEVDLTRQLVEAVEPDPRTWQLSCSLRWAPTEETAALGSANLWSFGTSWDRFFAEAMALPGWEWALGTRRPATFAVDLSLV
ncbi:hypothetical protein [Phycicoccus flavus]|uniref:Uncharacterized protein n=1 Tax=Phycicoccus flavus TaxID=2502783 RepID=A0A8T6QZU5_9MICO|nr:hypothetical protein [Phycicoccus flavus]NHA67649.1 hypothetical protein [Phycicoccus flavus]